MRSGAAGGNLPPMHAVWHGFNCERCLGALVGDRLAYYRDCGETADGGRPFFSLPVLCEPCEAVVYQREQEVEVQMELASLRRMYPRQLVGAALN